MGFGERRKAARKVTTLLTSASERVMQPVIRVPDLHGMFHVGILHADGIE